MRGTGLDAQVLPAARQQGLYRRDGSLPKRVVGICRGTVIRVGAAGGDFGPVAGGSRLGLSRQPFVRAFLELDHAFLADARPFFARDRAFGGRSLAWVEGE